MKEKEILLILIERHEFRQCTALFIRPLYEESIRRLRRMGEESERILCLGTMMKSGVNCARDVIN